MTKAQESHRCMMWCELLHAMLEERPLCLLSRKGQVVQLKLF